MLVYGDRADMAEPARLADEINRQLESVGQLRPGLERHSSLVGAFILAGRLLQGIEDAAFAQVKRDRSLPSAKALSRSLLELGRAVCRSWDSGFQEIGRLPRLAVESDWPEWIEARVPEGYAFYALYPEAYAEAARRLMLVGPARVIGIRSIGTSLAAVVAAALDTPAPVTVRPLGDPFARTVEIDAALAADLLGGDAHYVIVDEGPGQSGSSFGAVADWLQERGVPLERIALLPSHAGAPGRASTESRRQWWASVQRQVGDFQDRWPEMIANWCGAKLGPLDQSPEEISSGGWRPLRYAREDQWPAIVPAWERRKFLVAAGGERFLAKFAGLGRIGEEKLAIAGTLRCEGLVPEPIALVHGFLVERWYDQATPLGDDEKPLAEVARYVGTRARLLPAMSGSGATVEDLLTMTRRNVSLEFGESRALALDKWQRRTGELERRMVRVRTDNKLDRYEWLRTKSGALIKTDAVDHHQAHDLIGCQDVAWDCAGAITEFDMDQAASARFLEAIAQWTSGEVDAELLGFCRIAYLAFRLGAARLGATMVGDVREERRLALRGDRYAAELQHLLECTEAATRLDSLVG